MTRRLTFGLCLTVALGTLGCQDPPAAPTSTTTTQPELRKHPTAGRDLPDRGALTLPRSARITDQYLTDLARRAIDPDDYVCPASTPVVDWFTNEVVEFIVEEPARFELLYVKLWADLIPTYEALFFLTANRQQEFGYDGEFTNVLRRTERDAKRFWDIRSEQIQMVPLKGTMLQDPERVARTYRLPIGPPEPYNLSADSAAKVAAVIRQEVLASDVLDGGNHPLFSFNAFAFWTDDGSIPDKIIMGDGVLEGYAAVGFEDVAPQAVYAHEFAHHIQHQNGYFEEEPPPPPGGPRPDTGAEFTRYTELMADAYSAYYLTHKRGAALNRKRVAQFLQVFFQIGDCGFDSPAHHGTPNQRMAAAEFGFDVAHEAQKQGHILSSDQFHDLFVAAYPELIAPDAT
jgi:hypothetical protein